MSDVLLTDSASWAHVVGTSGRGSDMTDPAVTIPCRVLVPRRSKVRSFRGEDVTITANLLCDRLLSTGDIVVALGITYRVVSCEPSRDVEGSTHRWKAELA